MLLLWDFTKGMFFFLAVLTATVTMEWDTVEVKITIPPGQPMHFSSLAGIWV